MLHVLVKMTLGARVVLWWEHSPPTNEAWVWVPASTPNVGWICCWFTPFLLEVSLWVLHFPQKPTLFCNISGHVNRSSDELLSSSWANKLQFTIQSCTFRWKNIIVLDWFSVFEKFQPEFNFNQLQQLYIGRLELNKWFFVEYFREEFLPSE